MMAGAIAISLILASPSQATDYCHCPADNPPCHPVILGGCQVPPCWVNTIPCSTTATPTPTVAPTIAPTPTPTRTPAPGTPTPTPTAPAGTPTPTPPAGAFCCCPPALGGCGPVGIFGCVGQCYRVESCPCSDATPTPTPTPTPSVTPVAYTVHEFLRSSDIGRTYIQAMSLFNGVLWGNDGVCCPSIGQGPGECIFAIDYTQPTPAIHEAWCTYRDTTELWESGSVQVDLTDYGPLVVGGLTRRPADWRLGSAPRNVSMWTMSAGSGNTRWFLQALRRDAQLNPQIYAYFPLGLVRVFGIEYLYAESVDLAGDIYLKRFFWSEAYGALMWDSAFSPGKRLMHFTSIAVDDDNSLIALTGWYPDQTNTTIGLWRSTDEGKTWTNTGQTWEAPAGRTLFGCGFDRTQGGRAVKPFHLVCTIGTGKGPDQMPSDWNAAEIISEGGASIPHSDVLPVYVEPTPAAALGVTVKALAAPTPSGPRAQLGLTWLQRLPPPDILPAPTPPPKPTPKPTGTPTPSTGRP